MNYCLTNADFYLRVGLGVGVGVGVGGVGVGVGVVVVGVGVVWWWLKKVGKLEETHNSKTWDWRHWQHYNEHPI